MGKKSILPSPEFENFELLCKGLCDKSAYAVIVTEAGLSPSYYTKLKKGQPLGIEKLEKDFGVDGGQISIIEQLGISAANIDFIVRHGSLVYNLKRWNDLLLYDGREVLFMDIAFQHNIVIRKKDWAEWVTGQAPIPDDILDALLDYCKVSKETLLDYKLLKTDIRELFAEYFKDIKPRLTQQFLFTALHESERTIIINDGGSYKILCGNEEEFQKAIHAIMELHLRDFTDYLYSEGVSAQNVKPPMPQRSGRIPNALKVATEGAMKKMREK